MNQLTADNYVLVREAHKLMRHKRLVKKNKKFLFVFGTTAPNGQGPPHSRSFYEGWNFNSGNYLFTTDTK